MNDDILFVTNMVGGLFLVGRNAVRRSCVCSYRMSVADDSALSLNRLRSMQESIMRRRRGTLREVSTESDAENIDVPSVAASEEAGSPRTVAANGGKEPVRRKRGRPRKQVVHVKEGSSSSMTPPTSTLEAAASKAVVAPGLEITERIENGADNMLPDRRGTLSTAEAPGKFDCFLERLDGSLPVRDRSCEPMMPVLVRIPQLHEFTSPTSLKQSKWFLPRVNSMASIEFISHDLDPDAASSLSADCESILEALSPQQVTAVTSEPNRACLVLAGPGSGKTRVLTHRAAFLVRRYNLQPGRILAVTFTNKAAEEMKTRMRQLLSPGPESGLQSSFGNHDFLVGTFHSICARLLRVHGASIGIDSGFQICDAADARQVVAFIMKANVGAGSSDAVSSKVSMMTSMISKLKNNGEKEMEKRLPAHLFRELSQYRVLYDKKLREMNQLDFDDLLLETRRMLDLAPEVLLELQNKYMHILVDEWQDTNSVQFDIVTALAKEHNNLFVVGDADQSIYKFRGADIRNVTRFGETFPDAMTVALEENYRSTGCIVNSAQAVIEGNSGRPMKPMRTSNAFGTPVVICKASDGRAEATYIVKSVREKLRSNALRSLSDIAVLYRMNSQSRLVEEAFIKAALPYRLVAGTRFYDRQEVKDVLSYIRLLVNPVDDMALLRAINTPPRGIGRKTVEAVEEIASNQGVSLLQALENLCNPNSSLVENEVEDSSAMRKGALKKLADFLFIMKKLETDFADNIRGSGSEKGTGKNAAAVVEKVIELTDYRSFLEKRSLATGTKEINKFEERWQNIQELKAAANRYETLSEFMESVSLLSKPAGEEAEEQENQAVSLMTMHAGKGLEFGAVFIAGFEDGLLPMVRRDDDDNVEEERRLLYVGMTRAKQFLTLSWRARSLAFGSSRGSSYWRDSKPSRFLDDIPSNLLKKVETSPRFEGRSSKRTIHYSAGEKVQPKQWHVGDSVRCAKNGRGTIVSEPKKSATLEDLRVEVLFSSGKKRVLNPVQSSLELLYSPSSSN